MKRSKITITEKTTIINHESAQKHVNSIKPALSKMPIANVIDRIIRINEGLRIFWSSSQGWAPIKAAKLLSISRLDWQVSLSQCLRLWIEKPSVQYHDGYLILGWSNLGTLVEGTMKLFLSVYYETYRNDKEFQIIRQNKVQEPDALKFEMLRQYFKKRIWDASWDKWIRCIQKRRNAIHAYKNRAIGTHDEFLENIRSYLNLIRYINFRLPYPDDIYVPKETEDHITIETKIIIKNADKSKK